MTRRVSKFFAFVSIAVLPVFVMSPLWATQGPEIAVPAATDAADTEAESQAQTQAEAEAQAALDAARAMALSQELARYEQALQTLESDLGPYDSRLVESLLAMGNTALELGRFGDAAAVFERALSVTRINDGLYSAAQLPILENLIRAQKAAGEWGQADDKEHLALHIKTRLYTPGSQAYAEAVLAFADWKLQVARGNLLQRSSLSNMRDIDDLPVLYENALIEAPSPPEAGAALRLQTRFDLLYGKAFAQAQIADYALHSVPMNLERPVERYVSEYVCRDVVNAAGQVAQSCGMVRRENPQFRDQEMQRQLYRDRIQLAVNELQQSLREMDALLASNPALLTINNGAAPARIEELRTLQSALSRDFRRSLMRW